jgi:hypothetical protein
MKNFFGVLSLFFLMLPAFSQVDETLISSVKKFLVYHEDRDEGKYISLLPSTQRQFVDNEDYRMIQKKQNVSRPRWIGGFIKNIQLNENGTEAKVKFVTSEWAGRIEGDCTFVKEWNDWKYLPLYPYTAETLKEKTFDKIRSLPMPSTEDLQFKLTPAERFLLLQLNGTDFRLTLNKMVEKSAEPFKSEYAKLSFESFVRRYANKACEDYTEEELKEMNVFFESQLGLKHLYTRSNYESKKLAECWKEYLTEAYDKALKKFKTESIQNKASQASQPLPSNASLKNPK